MDTKIDDIFKKRDIITKQFTNKDDLCSELDVSALLAKSSVPYSHRRLANNYVTLKRVCPFQVVQPRITMVEQSLLNRYMLSTLENTTISQINSEIQKLKDWSISTDDKLREDSNELMKIRIKELKFILSNNYTTNTNEINKGYKAFETYLINITNYYK